MEQKDYYKILGITEEEKKLKGDEFSKLVSKKFKALALKFHPDRHVNDTEAQKKEAEAKFKEINEANAVLSDPQKREQYDNGGGPDLSDFFKHWGEGGGSPFSSMFQDFGFGFGHRGGGFGMGAVKGSDVNIAVHVTLEEAFRGTKKQVQYTKQVMCSHCRGTGSADGQMHTCSNCGGTGQVANTSRRGNMMMQQITVCPKCHGTGKEASEKCKFCGGTGLEKKNITEYIEVPAGVESNMSIRIDGLGNDAPQASAEQNISGDLIVTFIVDDNGYFVKAGNNNLVHYDQVPFKDAMLGFKKTYKTIDGGEVTVTVPECTPDGKAFFFYGKGMPDIYGRGYGDYAVVIKYIYPRSLTKKQKEALKEF